jgi:hypothetical protein
MGFFSASDGLPVHGDVVDADLVVALSDRGQPGEPDKVEVTADQLAGHDAVVCLAALSNDPQGDLNPAATYSVNLDGILHLARMAKQTGVPRFLFSSSCSLYGAAGSAAVAEDADLYPVTPYVESKVMAEQPDLRNYRVDFAKLVDTFPDLRMRWTVADGIGELLGSYVKYELTYEDFISSRYFRLRRIKDLLAIKEVDEMLRRPGVVG